MARLLCDLRGRHVLDPAYGSGLCTRVAGRAGAEHVVGSDISPEMVGMAERSEQAEPLGIEYLVADAAELPAPGTFDAVAANRLLNAAKP